MWDNHSFRGEVSPILANENPSGYSDIDCSGCLENRTSHCWLDHSFYRDCSRAIMRGQTMQRSAKQPHSSVLFKLGVSDHSKAYVPISREIVAQLEARKALILFGNSDLGRSYFEPGGRRFESVRAHMKSTTWPWYFYSLCHSGFHCHWTSSELCAGTA